MLGAVHGRLRELMLFAINYAVVVQQACEPLLSVEQMQKIATRINVIRTDVDKKQRLAKGGKKKKSKKPAVSVQ